MQLGVLLFGHLGIHETGEHRGANAPAGNAADGKDMLGKMRAMILDASQKSRRVLRCVEATAGCGYDKDRVGLGLICGAIGPGVDPLLELCGRPLTFSRGLAFDLRDDVVVVEVEHGEGHDEPDQN